MPPTHPPEMMIGGRGGNSEFRIPNSEFAIAPFTLNFFALNLLMVVYRTGFEIGHGDES